MKIATGNFANVKKYVAAGYYPISIAISARYFTGVSYRPLNPERSYMMEHENTYTPKFNRKLELLNPNQVMNDLHKLSEGKNVVLLCHEAEGEFCHRRLVAKWLKEKLNIEVPELGKMQPIQAQMQI